MSHREKAMEKIGVRQSQSTPRMMDAQPDESPNTHEDSFNLFNLSPWDGKGSGEALDKDREDVLFVVEHHSEDEAHYEGDKEKSVGEKTAAEILDAMAPQKSSAAYEKAWIDFTDYRKGRDNIEEEPKEDIYVRYFDFLKNEKGFVASTMWTKFSLLNNCHQVSSYVIIEQLLAYICTYGS